VIINQLDDLLLFEYFLQLHDVNVQVNQGDDEY
jgi:hypothetical protein